MDALSPGWLRCWIIRAVGRNPLVRLIDRLEAVALVVLFAIALVVTPVAGAIGTAVYEGRMRLYAEEAQTRHPVLATVVDHGVIIVEQDAETFRTRISWYANGIERFGSVDLAYETNVGDQLDIWVDSRGDQIAAPTPTWRAGIDAMLAGAGAWLVAMAGVTGLSLLVRWWLTCRRDSGWEREWQAPVRADGKTDRQT